MTTAWFAFPVFVLTATKALAGLLLAVAGLPQEPAPTKARVTGRCLAAETQAPLKGVTVQAGTMRNSFVIKDATAPRRLGAEAQTVTTDAEGRFTVDVEPPTPAQLPVAILASMPGRAPWVTSRTMVGAGDTIDVGDFELRVGFTVRGRVVDPAGAPVAGEGLLVPGTLVAPNAVALVMIRLSARSDEKGEFTFNAPLPAGTWELVLADRRHRLQEPDRLKVGSDAAPEPLTVVVDVAGGGRGGKALPPAGNLTFELTVVEKGTGKPIEAFGVRCHPAQTRSPRAMALRLDGHHEGGRVIVDEVSEAAHLLQVVPREGFERSEKVEILARDGKIAPVRVELERLQAYAFVVQREDGTPVNGTTCQLGDGRGQVIDLRTGFVDELRLPIGLEHLARVPQLLATASSDASGRVVLYGKRDVTDLRIRVLGPGHLATVVAVKPAGDDPQQIVVSTGATIEGTVGPQPLLALWQPKLVLRRADTPVPRNPGPKAIVIDKEGRFRFENVEAGEWVVSPVMVLSMQRGTTRGESLVRLFGAEGKVEVGATGKFEVAIDLGAWQPATLEGIVSQEGAAKVGGVVVLVGELGSESWQCGAFAVDDTGRFQAKGLPPGKYRLQWYREAEATHPVVHADAVELAPGKSVPREFHFGK